jgi:hypothetical protein
MKLHWTPSVAHFGDPTFTAQVQVGERIVTVTRVHARRKVRGYRVGDVTHPTLTAALAAATTVREGVKGHGLLRHRFHGTYSATIGLHFERTADATHALRYLGPGWKFSPHDACDLVWFGGGEPLDRCTDILARYGADPKAVRSLRTSVDFGEPFTVTLPEAS